MPALKRLPWIFALALLPGYAQVTVGPGSTIVAGGNPTQGVTSVNGNSGALVIQGTGASCNYSAGTTTCSFNGGSSGNGFPISLGTTSIGAGSTVTSLNGLTVNGVTLKNTGTGSNFLSDAGSYLPVSGSGTVNT